MRSVNYGLVAGTAICLSLIALCLTENASPHIGVIIGTVSTIALGMFGFGGTVGFGSSMRHAGGDYAKAKAATSADSSAP